MARYRGPVGKVSRRLGFGITEKGERILNKRSFPPGMSVEVLRTDALAEALPQMTEPADREHVTRWFYAGGAGVQIVNFAADAPRRDVHLAVDTPEHFELVRQVIAAMTRPHWEYGLAGVLELVDRVRAAARPESGRPSTYLQVRP